MTIEKIIEIYSDLDRIGGTLLRGNSEEDTKYNSETIEALQSINIILHKYQNIQEAYKKYQNDLVTNIYADRKFIEALEGVLEDGNDN